MNEIYRRTVHNYAKNVHDNKFKNIFERYLLKYNCNIKIVMVLYSTGTL